MTTPSANAALFLRLLLAARWVGFVDDRFTSNAIHERDAEVCHTGGECEAVAVVRTLRKIHSKDFLKLFQATTISRRCIFKYGRPVIAYAQGRVRDVLVNHHCASRPTRNARLSLRRARLTNEKDKENEEREACGCVDPQVESTIRLLQLHDQGYKRSDWSRKNRESRREMKVCRKASVVQSKNDSEVLVLVHDNLEVSVKSAHIGPVS